MAIYPFEHKDNINLGLKSHMRRRANPSNRAAAAVNKASRELFTGINRANIRTAKRNAIAAAAAVYRYGGNDATVDATAYVAAAAAADADASDATPHSFILGAKAADARADRRAAIKHGVGATAGGAWDGTKWTLKKTWSGMKWSARGPVGQSIGSTALMPFKALGNTAEFLGNNSTPILLGTTGLLFAGGLAGLAYAVNVNQRQHNWADQVNGHSLQSADNSMRLLSNYSMPYTQILGNITGSVDPYGSLIFPQQQLMHNPYVDSGYRGLPPNYNPVPMNPINMPPPQQPMWGSGVMGNPQQPQNPARNQMGGQEQSPISAKLQQQANKNQILQNAASEIGDQNDLSKKLDIVDKYDTELKKIGVTNSPDCIFNNVHDKKLQAAKRLGITDADTLNSYYEDVGKTQVALYKKIHIAAMQGRGAGYDSLEELINNGSDTDLNRVMSSLKKLGQDGFQSGMHKEAFDKLMEMENNHDEPKYFNKDLEEVFGNITPRKPANKRANSNGQILIKNVNNKNKITLKVQGDKLYPDMPVWAAEIISADRLASLGVKSYSNVQLNGIEFDNSGDGILQGWLTFKDENGDDKYYDLSELKYSENNVSDVLDNEDLKTLQKLCSHAKTGRNNGTVEAEITWLVSKAVSQLTSNKTGFETFERNGSGSSSGLNAVPSGVNLGPPIGAGVA